MIINIYYRPIVQTVNIGNNNNNINICNTDNGNVSQAARNEADTAAKPTDGQSTGRPEYPAMLEQAQETAAEIAAIKAETAKFRAMAERQAKAAKRPKKAKTNAKKGAI